MCRARTEKKPTVYVSTNPHDRVANCCNCCARSSMSLSIADFHPESISAGSQCLLLRGSTIAVPRIRPISFNSVSTKVHIFQPFSTFKKRYHLTKRSSCCGRRSRVFCFPLAPRRKRSIRRTALPFILPCYYAGHNTFALGVTLIPVLSTFCLLLDTTGESDTRAWLRSRLVLQARAPMKCQFWAETSSYKSPALHGE